MNPKLLPAMDNNISWHSTKAGTFGGTLLVVLLQIQTAELLKTAILAAIGATASFIVSLIWRWVIKKLRQKLK